MNAITLPVMRPRLPSADQVLPYLRRIDAARWYSNFGPLAQELEARMAVRWGMSPACALSLSSATSGLSVALMAAQAPVGSLCLIPSWTFVATAHAVMQAGLTPFLCDVDERTGTLTPALAEAALAAAPAAVGAAMPVCPFGAAIDWEGWAEFRRRTGLAVVVDAAAAFDTVRPGPLPTVISLHATKVLAAGEGGLLLCEDGELIIRARRHANFGFFGDHRSQVRATNAKMSEYHAAVGLASLDDWPNIRATWQGALGRVQAAARAIPHRWPAGLGEDYVCSSPSIRVADAAALAGRLRAEGIEARQWWRGGIGSHPAFAALPAMDLPATAALARSTLALPCWPDLDVAAAGRLGEALARHGAG